MASTRLPEAGLERGACEGGMKGLGISLSGEAVAHGQLLAAQIDELVILAADRIEKARDLVLDSIGEAVLRRHQIDEVGKPAFNVLAEIGWLLGEVRKL